MDSEENEESSHRYYAPKVPYGSWVIVACMSVFIAVAIRTYLLQGFIIPSESMTPTLIVGDLVLVDKLFYHLKSDTKKFLPAKDEVVVFEHSEKQREEANLPAMNYIKRVVGLPGDKVEIRDFEVFINGKKDSSQRYRVMMPRARDLQTTRANYGPVTLGPTQYFVLGDNRANSIDSRAFGPIELDQIVGRAVLIYWSWDPDLKWKQIRWERVFRKLR